MKTTTKEKDGGGKNRVQQRDDASKKKEGRRERMAKTAKVDAGVSLLYDIGQKIGKGAFGIVWKGEERRTKRCVALKKIYDAFQNATDAQRTFREIMFLNEFRCHPNIVRLLDLHKAANDRDIYLVFEYMDMDLHNIIKKGNILNNVHKKYITYQLLKAIKFIHSAGVIHRDLKPSNILVNKKCECKVADFGLSRSLSAEACPPRAAASEASGSGGSGDCCQATRRQRCAADDAPPLTNYVATRWYRAPEILTSAKRYTKGVDMWSLGCIIAEMFLGKPLFPGDSTSHQIEIVMAAIPWPSQSDVDQACGLNYAGDLAQKFVKLEGHSKGGLSLVQIMAPAGTPDDAMDLITRLLVFNPLKRPTAVTALKHAYVSSFHNSANEPAFSCPIVPILRDDVRLTVDDYRRTLYTAIDSAARARAVAERKPSSSAAAKKTDTRDYIEDGRCLEYLAEQCRTVPPGHGRNWRVICSLVKNTRAGARHGENAATGDAAGEREAAHKEKRKVLARIKGEELKRRTLPSSEERKAEPQRDGGDWCCDHKRAAPAPSRVKPPLAGVHTATLASKVQGVSWAQQRQSQPPHQVAAKQAAPARKESAVHAGHCCHRHAPIERKKKSPVRKGSGLVGQSLFKAGAAVVGRSAAPSAPLKHVAEKVPSGHHHHHHHHHHRQTSAGVRPPSALLFPHCRCRHHT